jgi:transcriptional regulator with XRE-family HTH domain
MNTAICVPPLLFALCEAAGFQKKDIAARLGVSKTLVTLWTKNQRTLSLPHFDALVDLILHPATICAIAERLKAEGSIPGGHDQPALTPIDLFDKLCWLVFYRDLHIYQDIATLTQQLAAATRTDPLSWDVLRLRELNQQLSEHLSSIPQQKLHLDPRLEKAIWTLKAALGIGDDPESPGEQEDHHAETHVTRRSPDQSHD